MKHQKQQNFIQGPRHQRDGGGWGWGGGAWPTIFLGTKKKKGKQRKNRKSFKAETIKKLSPRSKCCYFSHSRASSIQKMFLPRLFLVFHDPSTLKSISPALLFKLQQLEFDFSFHGEYFLQEYMSLFLSFTGIFSPTIF